MHRTYSQLLLKEKEKDLKSQPANKIISHAIHHRIQIWRGSIFEIAIMTLLSHQHWPTVGNLNCVPNSAIKL